MDNVPSATHTTKIMERSAQRSALLDLPDDVLIYLFDLVQIPGILIIRQTCKRMQKISELRIVWTNACTHRILEHGYPFPDVPPADLSVLDLERHTRRAHRLASWWLSSDPSHPTVLSEFDATNGTPVSDLRFIPGHDGRWLLSESMGIWSILCLWELSDDGAEPRKKFEWSRRDCLLRSFQLNDDPSSDATLALSVTQDGAAHVEIMSIHEDEGFRSLRRIDSVFSPLYLHGDTLVLCDRMKTSIVTNWKTGASAILDMPPQEAGPALGFYDEGIQAMFTADCILVVRAQCLVLFPNPPLTIGPPVVHRPLVEHSFGWVDGVAVTTIVEPSSASNPVISKPLSILVRPESDDPWAAEPYNVDLYVLHPTESPSALPYAFPPTRTARVESTRGALQCSTVRFAPHGTAVWVEPQDRSGLGLFAMEGGEQAAVGSQVVNQRLVCAAFPGPLSRHAEFPEVTSMRARTLRTNDLNNWKAMDYDEVHGLVAVGSTRGKITVLSLAS